MTENEIYAALSIGGIVLIFFIVAIIDIFDTK